MQPRSSVETWRQSEVQPSGGVPTVVTTDSAKVQQPQQDGDWQQPATPAAPEASMAQAPAPAPIPTPAAVEPVVTAEVPAYDTIPEQPQPLQPEPVAYSENGTEPEAVIEPSLPEGEDELVRWQATEHIHREKDSMWYVIFGIVVVALIAVAIFLIKSWTFAVLVPVMAAALVIYTRRPPALITYTLSRKGLHINDRLYAFDLYKEFGLIHDDDENAVLLVPRKRFQPGVTVYFPDEVGEVVVDMLAARLPMHEVRLDPIDRLIRRLHI